jgi:hypothetical protein
MHFDGFMSQVLALFPNAIVDESSDTGELVIYTHKMCDHANHVVELEL